MVLTHLLTYRLGLRTPHPGSGDAVTVLAPGDAVCWDRDSLRRLETALALDPTSSRRGEGDCVLGFSSILTYSARCYDHRP